MSDVRVEFSADIKDLQKGAKQAIKEVQNFGDAQKKVTSSTSGLEKASSKASRSIAKGADATKQARFAMTNLNRVVSDAPFGFIAIQNNIDQALVSFGSLVSTTGSAKSALAALASSFTGIGGIITVVTLASSLYLAFGDNIKAAFAKGRVAAEEAKKAFSEALTEFVKVDQTFSDASFDRSSLLGAIKETESAIAALKAENARKPVGGKGQLNLGATLGGKESRFDDIQRAVDANSALIEQEEETLKILKQQLAVSEAQFRAQSRVIALGARTNISTGTSDISISGSDEIAPPIDRSTLDDLKQFEQLRIDAISKNIELAKSFDVVTAALDRENSALFDQREAAEAKALRDEIAINNNNRIAESSRQASTQLENVGQLIAVELGQEAAASVADLVTGFSNLQDVLGNIKGVLRNVVAQIAAAAAKAAILSVLFPGAGGIGSIFKGVLGLATGGGGGGAVVGGAVSSVVGQAGPRAIAPLNQLSGIGSQRLEVVPAVLPSGDILVGLREANNNRSGRGGRIDI